MGTRISKKYGRVTFFVSVAIFAVFFCVNNSYGSMQLSQVSPPNLTPPTCASPDYFEIGGYPAMGGVGKFPKASCDSCKQAIQGQQSSVAGAMSSANSADASAAASSANQASGAAGATTATQNSPLSNNGVSHCGGGSGLTNQAGIADGLSNQLNSCASAIDSACGGQMAQQDSSAAKAAADSCRAKSAQAKAVSSSKTADAGGMNSTCAQSDQKAQGLDQLAQAAGQAAQAAAGMQPQPQTPTPTPTTPTLGNVSTTDLGKNNVEASKVAVNTIDNLGATSGFEAKTGNSPIGGSRSSLADSGSTAGTTVSGAGSGAASGAGNVSSAGGSSSSSGGAAGADSKNAAEITGTGKPGEEGGSSYGSGGGGYSGSKPVLGLSVDSNDLVNTFGVAAGSVLGGLGANLGRDPSSKGDYEDDEIKQSLFIRIRLKINKVAKNQNFLVAAPSKD